MPWGWIFFSILLGIAAILILSNLNKIRQFIEALKVFYHEVAFEMTKVVWPSQNEIVNSTILVIVITTVMTLGLMIVDFVLGNVAKMFFGQA